MMRKFEHICEVCGITKVMTPQEAFEEGWDYPPLMGSFGVVNMIHGVSEIGKAIQQLNNDLLKFYTPQYKIYAIEKILQNPNWNIF